MRQNNTARTVITAGLLGALGDFVFALAYYGPHLAVFQNVAGGLIGVESARAGGVPTFVLGVLLHFVVGVIWAALFWVLTRIWPGLLRRPVLAGLAFGVVVFYGMYEVVLPLSALHTRAWPPRWLPVDLVSHMLLVGLPIALTIDRGTVSRSASAAATTR